MAKHDHIESEDVEGQILKEAAVTGAAAAALFAGATAKRARAGRFVKATARRTGIAQSAANAPRATPAHWVNPDSGAAGAQKGDPNAGAASAQKSAGKKSAKAPAAKQKRR